MKQTLLRNASIVTMNKTRDQIENADILINGDRIEKVGQVRFEYEPEDLEVIDLTGKIIMPGLINTHVHLSQQLGRGIADDVDLLTWLRKRIWPYESEISFEDSYVSSQACCAELIRSGVTTFAEAGGQEVDAMFKAVKESGLRVALSCSIMDQGEGLPSKWQNSTSDLLDKQVANYWKYNGSSNGRIRYWFCLRTIFNNSDNLILQTKYLADQLNTGIHMHVAEIPYENDFVRETRKSSSTVDHLANLGVLGSNLLAVHCVWLSDRDIDSFRLNNVKVAHCPAAAMKVALGFARIPEMLDKGINVSIGTDGAPSNNHMDMMREMHLASLIHKGRTLNPCVVPAEQIIEMATINGARSVLWEDEIGSLEPGKKADLIVINPRSIGSVPIHNRLANLVYAGDSTTVESSMCNGEWLMRENRILTLNEDEIINEAEKRAYDLIRRAGIQL